MSGAASSDSLTAAVNDRAEKTAEARVAPRDAAGFRPLIDDRQFISKPRAMRLEPETDEPSRSIAKPISFPVRVPFAVSGDSFAIAGNDVEAIEASVSGHKVESLKNDGGERSATPGSWRSLTREPRDKHAGLSASSGDNAGGTQPASRTAKMMSASPAGGSFYVYSFDGRLLAEYNLYGECVRDYIYVGAQLVAEFRPSTSQYYYYMSDQINSTRVVTDDTGTVVYSAAYDPYGGIQRNWVNAFDPALKFSGKERDGESGLDYFGARYYDKSQYRFAQADVAIDLAGACRNPQGWNAYAYDLDNPLRISSPSEVSRDTGRIGPVSIRKQRQPDQHLYPYSQYQNPYKPNEKRPVWSSLLKNTKKWYEEEENPNGKPDLITFYFNEVGYMLPASVGPYEPPDDLFGGSFSLDALFNMPQNALIDDLWKMLILTNGGFPVAPDDDKPAN